MLAASSSGSGYWEAGRSALGEALVELLPRDCAATITINDAKHFLDLVVVHLERGALAPHLPKCPRKLSLDTCMLPLSRNSSLKSQSKLCTHSLHELGLVELSVAVGVELFEESLPAHPLHLLVARVNETLRGTNSGRVSRTTTTESAEHLLPIKGSLDSNPS